MILPHLPPPVVFCGVQLDLKCLHCALPCITIDPAVALHGSHTSSIGSTLSIVLALLVEC